VKKRVSFGRRRARKVKKTHHGLGGNHLDDRGVSRLDELGLVLDRLSGTAVNLLEESVELAGNVGGVAL